MKRLLLSSLLFLSYCIAFSQTSITSTPVTTATVGSQYTYPLLAVTNTNSPITYSSITTLPSFLTLSSSGQSQGQAIGDPISNIGAVASDPVTGNYYVVQNYDNGIYKITSSGVTTLFASRTGLQGSTYGGPLL